MKTEIDNTIQIHDRDFEPFIGEEEIDAAVQEIASKINIEYNGNSVVLVGVLKGAFVFLNALVQKITLPVEIEFIRISSYEGLSSTGEITLSLDFPSTITGKHIILVEDIIDTGRTAQFLVNHGKSFEPESIKVASLLVKPESVISGTPIDYVGISIPDKFVVGYGMDYDEKGRELPRIYQVCG